MTSSSGPVGMIGLGNMGRRMATRMLDAGIEVIGVDPDPAARHAFRGRMADGVGELSAACDVIMLSLPDSRVIEQVMQGPAGLIDAVGDGQVVVDLSTADPSSTRRLYALLAARGAQLLDAGISGGAAAAEGGTLSLMVGGDPRALDSVTPYLQTFSSRIFHMGESGSGHVAKVLNNFLNGVALAATAEVMVAGRIAGLDLSQLLEVLNSSSGVNFATLNRFPRIVKGDYLEGGLTGRLMAKDLDLYLALMNQLDATSLVGPATLTTFRVSNGMGYADMISNRVVDALGDLAGGVRVSDGGSDSAEER